MRLVAKRSKLPTCRPKNNEPYSVSLLLLPLVLLVCELDFELAIELDFELVVELVCEVPLALASLANLADFAAGAAAAFFLGRLIAPGAGDGSGPAFTSRTAMGSASES